MEAQPIISRGSGSLRQWGPLSPFLFTLEVEGFACMVKKATKIGEFKRFMVNEQVELPNTPVGRWYNIGRG